MEDTTYGSIPFSDEDRRYQGSRFSEVRDAVFAKPYQQQWGSAEPLPVHKVTLISVLKGILPLGARWRFLQAAERTVDSQADLRWGYERGGFRRLLHPNGICLTGKWEITEETNYSGYFKKGSEALIIGRYSTCCTETRRGRSRSLALTGKLYPTSDANHSESVVTANFFTQQDLGGENCRYINDAELRNAPDTRAWRRGTGLPILLLTGVVLLRADKEPANRQLYPIAELGKAGDEATCTPEFMRLKVVADQSLVDGDDMDFRDEIMAHLYDKGDPVPKRALSFDIDVSDTGKTEGTPFFQKRIIANWRTVGRITFTEAVVSYNGDFVLHFNHPTWRDDRNNPATATRIDGRKVR